MLIRLPDTQCRTQSVGSRNTDPGFLHVMRITSRGRFDTHMAQADNLTGQSDGKLLPGEKAPVAGIRSSQPPDAQRRDAASLAAGYQAGIQHSPIERSRWSQLARV